MMSFNSEIRVAKMRGAKWLAIQVFFKIFCFVFNDTLMSAKY